MQRKNKKWKSSWLPISFLPRRLPLRLTVISNVCPPLTSNQKYFTFEHFITCDMILWSRVCPRNSCAVLKRRCLIIEKLVLSAGFIISSDILAQLSAGWHKNTSIQFSFSMAHAQVFIVRWSQRREAPQSDYSHPKAQHTDAASRDVAFTGCTNNGAIYSDYATECSLYRAHVLSYRVQTMQWCLTKSVH